MIKGLIPAGDRQSRAPDGAQASQSLSLDDGSGAGPLADLPLDEIFEILRNQRRRWVLRYLQEHDGVVEIGEVAEHIAAIETDKSISELTSGERKRVYVALYQCHLPKMDDAGVVDYHQDRGHIELVDAVEQLDTYLGFHSDGATSSGGNRSGALLSAALGLATFVAFLGVLAGTTPGWLSPTAVLGAVSVAALVNAGVQLLGAADAIGWPDPD